MFCLTRLRNHGVTTMALVLLSGLSLPGQAAQIVFDTDPFAGSTALTTAGRQVVGNELFLPSFDFNADQFVFDRNIFGITGLQFFNGLVSGLPSSGVNLVILQDTDNDANLATAFNAGTAANLIAAQITADGPGFFIYHNQGLGLNRLVFSTNLNDSAADLKILARIQAPILVLGAEKDVIFRSEGYAAAFAGNANAKVDIVPGVGHFELSLSDEAPRRFAHWLTNMR